MNKIYKYPITHFHEKNLIEMPKGAVILSVGVQNDKDVVLWAQCDVDAGTVERRIFSVMTGEEFDQSLGTFIGTVQVGWFVAHIFDGGEVE